MTQLTFPYGGEKTPSKWELGKYLSRMHNSFVQIGHSVKKKKLMTINS